MTRDEALAIVQRLLNGARRGDLDAVRDCYAEDAVAVSPAFGHVRGRDAILQTWARLFASTDVSVDISTILVDGNRVAVLGAITTSDLAGWFGQPSVSIPIGYRLVLLFTLAGGKVVSDERLYDSGGLLERLEKARLDKELRSAADVQRALTARTARVGGFYDATAESIPCRAIGGDFFEFLELASGDVGIVMGDVAGKGPPAALLAAMLQGMFVAEPDGRNPSATLDRINRRLAARDLGARFATLVYAVLSPSGRLVSSNAGHNPPALVTRAGIRRLTAGGPVLGAFAEATYADEAHDLERGDALVMFTDGVTEARNADDEEYGEAGLMASLRGIDGLAPTAALERVLGDVRAFCRDAEPQDDITVSVTRFG
jgi:ketosteroid isomerase-like protein